MSSPQPSTTLGLINHEKELTPLYFQWDCISPQQDNQWNFSSVVNLSRRNTVIKPFCFWYRWLSCCKLLGDLPAKLLNFCIIFLLPKNTNRTPDSWTERKQAKPASTKIPHSPSVIFILLWEVGAIKHTFCPILLIVFNQGLGLVLGKNTRNSILNILE